MKVIVPADTTTFTSDVAENEYPAWTTGTTYALGARVITASSHQVWQSARAGNQGNNPLTAATSADGATINWVLVGATDRWKPFDKKVSDIATRNGNMTWTITLPTRADSLALFGLGASSVRVRITLSGSVLYDVTHQVIDTTSIMDWYDFFTYQPEFDTEMVLTDLPAFAGSTVQITFAAGGGSTSIGEIVLGQVKTLGVSQEGTSVGITDYSIKERDDWGNPVIVERAFADTTNFSFAMPMGDARRVKRILSSLRATPAVYFVDADTEKLGTTIFGFFSDFDIPLTHGMSFANLEIEGLV